MTVITDWRLRVSDGVRLEGQTWEPPCPRGELILVHGLGEHLGRFHEMASFFAERGLRIVLYSHRGHGRSSGPRCHSPSFNRLLDDLREVLHAKGTPADLPTFIFGHSMGGCIVLSFALRASADAAADHGVAKNASERPGLTCHRLAGVIAASPLLLPAQPVPAWKKRLAQLADILYPRLVFDPHIDPSILTRDERIQASLQRDPLWRPFITARLALELFAAGQRALDHAASLTLPALLLHGSDDALTDPEATRRFAEISSEQSTFILFPGMRHELHHDIGRTDVWGRIWRWIDRRISESSATRSTHVSRPASMSRM